MEAEVKETPEPKRIVTCEDWEELFAQLANPKCSKCFGRGHTGWGEIKSKNEKGVEVITKMPRGCSAKGCSIRNLQKLQREQKVAEMKAKIAKRKEKNENRTDT